MSDLAWYQQLRWRAFLTFLFIFVVLSIPLWVVVDSGQISEDPMRAASRALGLATVATIVSAFIAAVLGGEYMGRRLEAARRTLSGAVAGDRQLARSRDEIADLAAVVGDSVGGLREQMLKLQQEKGRLSALLDGMGEAVLVTDERERILLANPVAEKLLHLPDDFKGQRLADVLELPRVLALASEVLWSRRTATVDVDYPHRDEVRHLSVSASPISTDGQTFGAVLLFYDVTRLRRLERVRRDFVANVSHELRTPIAAVQSVAETMLLAELPLDDVMLDFLRTIERNAVRMANIVEDLLTLSRLEAAGVEGELREVALAPILAELVDQCEPLARAGGLKLEVDVEDEIPSVLGEPTAIRQILENLVENAIKYTARGGTVTLRLRVRHHKRVRFEVQDTGIGIAPEHLPRVFERFYRVDSGRSREIGGTGLGLAIVKHLVRALKGRIVVESTLGEGTTFKVWLRVFDPERKR